LLKLLNNMSDNIVVNEESSEPLRPRPVVLLLLDGWGIAPANEEVNALAAADTPIFLSLINNYPVALLNPGNKSWNGRYLSLGAGKEFSNEDDQPTITLTEIIANNNLRQIKITESERLAALTHFFTGHLDNQLIGEEWNIVSSEAGDHRRKPTLALKKIVRETIRSIKSEHYDFIAVAIPTIDLVALSADFRAVQRAAQLIDDSLEKIVSEVLNKKGVLIVTSAGGNGERMRNLATDLPDRELTLNPLPLIIVGEDYKGQNIGLKDPVNNDLSTLQPVGTLADVAPTILRIMNLPQPIDMSGENLID